MIFWKLHPKSWKSFTVISKSASASTMKKVSPTSQKAPIKSSNIFSPTAAPYLYSISRFLPFNHHKKSIALLNQIQDLGFWLSDHTAPLPLNHQERHIIFKKRPHTLQFQGFSPFLSPWSNSRFTSNTIEITQLILHSLLIKIKPTSNINIYTHPLKLYQTI